MTKPSRCIASGWRNPIAFNIDWSVSVPSHVEHEKRFIGRRLPPQTLARAINCDILVQADAGNVVLEDLQGLAIPGEARGLVEGCARFLDRFVVGRIVVF